MLQCFPISCEKGGMEDRVNLPSRGNMKLEGCVRDDFLDLKGAGSFHLEFLGSVHVEVGGLKPDLISYFPWGELRGYPLLHLLLGDLVSSLGIVMSGREI